MNPTTEFRLTDYDRMRLGEASREMFSTYAAEDRVGVYVRRGYTVAEAVEYAIVWAKNMTEQAARRLAHETGAEGWRRKSWEVLDG